MANKNDLSEKFKVGETTRSLISNCGWQGSYRFKTSSTNQDVRDGLTASSFDGSQLALFITDDQTNGRGRGTNKWETPHPGDYLLSSWVLPLKDSPPHTTAPQVGLRLWQACRDAWPSLQWSLKAPNDIYLGDKKLAGLLIENVQVGRQNTLIVGLGLNVFSSPSHISSATSLSNEIHVRKEDWKAFVISWMQSLEGLLNGIPTDIPAADCDLLLTALNSSPKGALYQNVSPQGDLKTHEKIIKWWEL